MKKLGSALKAVLPHASIICAMMILIFIVIDHFNRYIGFMSHNMTKWLLVIWVFISIAVSVMQIAAQRREWTAAERTQEKPCRAADEPQPEAQDIPYERQEEERAAPSKKTPPRAGRHIKG